MNLLSVARKHAAKVISLDPHTITGATVQTFSTTRYGGKAQSETSTPWADDGTIVRIAKNNDRLTIPERDGDDTPNQMTNTYYMISPYDVIIPQKLVFTYGEKTFKTKIPEPVRHNDAVAYYRTQLDEVTQYD